MLWLAVVLPELPLLAFDSHSNFFAVAENRMLVACNDSAKNKGIHSGISVSQANALCFSLEIKERDISTESSILEILAALVYQLSPKVMVRFPGILAQFTDKVTPHKNPETLCVKLRQDLDFLGYNGCVAMAPTAQAAWLAAMQGESCVLTARDAWQKHIELWPITALSLDSSIHALLKELGILSIKDCLALSRSALRRRFGVEIIHTLERLLGERPEPFSPWQPPAIFERKLVFSYAINEVEPFLFIFQRLAREISQVILVRNASVRSFKLTLFLEDMSVLCETFSLVVPVRQARDFLTMVRERITHIHLVSAITACTLFASLDISVSENLPLWEDSLATEADFKKLWDRLQARLGIDGPRTVHWVPDHRPERSVIEKSWHSSVDFVCDQDLKSRPTWLVDPPEELKVINGDPYWHGSLQIIEGPEIIETGWWEESIVRQYFVAQTRVRERIWIFQSSDGKWFMQGIFS